MDIVLSRIEEWISKENVKATLNLDGLGLEDIPPVPENVERLNVDGNKIKYLRLDQLPQKITTLYIRTNGLERIEWLPETLIDLNASNNVLTELPPLPPKLIALDISYNNMMTLPNIPRRLDLLYCWGNPMPSHLIEEVEPMYSCYWDMYHLDRIRLWRKYLKRKQSV